MNYHNKKGIAHNLINKWIAEIEDRLLEEDKPVFTKSQSQQQKYAAILEQGKGIKAPKVLTYEAAKARLKKYGYNTSIFTKDFYKKQVEQLQADFLESGRNTYEGNITYFKELEKNAILNIITSRNNKILNDDLIYLIQKGETDSSLLNDLYNSFKYDYDHLSTDEFERKWGITISDKKSLGESWNDLKYLPEFSENLYSMLNTEYGRDLFKGD